MMALVKVGRIAVEYASHPDAASQRSSSPIDRDDVLDKRLRLGTFFGIDLFVHWTFGLLIAYMVAVSWSEGPEGIAYGIARLLGVFFCVTLHEYGHALTARVFHVPTIDITLLPIGGVARLKHMPRVPWQELLVAVAGPAVNVVIVSLLIMGIATYQAFTSATSGLGSLDTNTIGVQEFLIRLSDQVLQPSVWGFVLTMLLVNVMLVLFNMIPAFPMDGGRVLRSVLAMVMNYRRATFIASRIGLVCAGLMAYYALQIGEFMPVLIAGFIAFAGMNEARQVDVMESLRGLTVSDVMVRHTASVPMNTPVREVAAYWQSTSASVLPVTSFVGSVVGVVELKQFAKAIENGTSPDTPIGAIVDHSIAPASLDESLESIVLSGGKGHRVFPVVGPAGELIGTLDLDSVLARGTLGSVADTTPLEISTSDARQMGRRENPYEPPPQFDKFT